MTDTDNIVERWKKYRDNQLQLGTPACDFADDMADLIESQQATITDLVGVAKDSEYGTNYLEQHYPELLKEKTDE